jgi:hypothetical protein
MRGITVFLWGAGQDLESREFVENVKIFEKQVELWWD